MRPNNEWKVCDAVVRILEKRAGISRENARSPERDRVGPPVEYRFDLDGEHYALEHTFIEPFEDEVRTGAHFQAFIRPILQELEYAMPLPGVYYANFPLNPSDRLKPRDRMVVQAKVVEWLRTSAQKLYEQKPTLGPHDLYGEDFYVREQPDGVPFEIHLSRSLFRGIPQKVDGRLFVSRFAPTDYENMRVERIRRAFDTKCPKLERCKSEGARTILALEASDISLTNHIIVGEAVARVLSERADAPSEIFYIDTTIEERWTVWSLWRNGCLWPDEETQARYQEFAPEDLRDV